MPRSAATSASGPAVTSEGCSDLNSPNFDPLIGAKNFEPYLVGGELYVTPRQYQSMLRIARELEGPGDKLLSSVVGNIPVTVVPPGGSVDVGGGQMATCEADGSKVVFYAKDVAIAQPWEPEPPPPDPPIRFGPSGKGSRVFRNEQPEGKS